MGAPGGPTLTVAGYRATGGIRSAVSQTAETLYEALDPAQRGRLRTLLLRLVVPTDDGDAVRARVSRARVTADAGQAELVELLVHARLVITDGDTVQIAHEALVRAWPRLRGWLDDDRDGQRVLRHLAGAAEAWDTMGRPESELYRGARLSRALEWRERALPDLTGAEVGFLDASAALAESELRLAEHRLRAQRRTNGRLRAALVGVAALLLLSLVAGLLAMDSAGQARRERLRAQELAAAAREAAEVSAARAASARAVGEADLSTSLLVHLAALAVDDGAPQVWENLADTLVRAGTLRRRGLPTGTDALSVSTDVSRDGRTIATSNPIDGVQLYDAETFAPVPFVNDTPSSIVRFSPDGRYLAAAVNQWNADDLPRIADLPLRLYDVGTGRLAEGQLGGWPAQASIEYQLDFSADGRRIGAGVNRWNPSAGEWRPVGAAMVWDLDHPRVPIFRHPIADNSAVALSPDGHRLYSLSDSRLRAYDVDTGRLLASRPWTVDHPGDLEVSTDGGLVAVGAGDHVALLDAATLVSEEVTLRGAAGGDLIEFSHDGSMVLTASAGAGATAWDLATGVPVSRLSLFDGWDLRWTPDDSGVVASGFGTLQAWDVLGTGAFLAKGRVSTADDLSQSIAAPNGRTVARRSGLRLWFEDDVTGQRTPRAQTRSTVLGWAWSPDSRWLAISSWGVLSVWDARRGRLVGERSFAPEEVPVAAFSPDSERIHVADGEGFLRTLDRATLEPVLTATIVGELVTLLTLPDGTVIYLSSAGTLHVVDPEQREIVRSSAAGLIDVDDYEDGAPLGAVSPEGSRVVARHPDGDLRLFRIDTLEWQDPVAPPGWGHNVAYSSDGRQFAAVVGDELRLHDGATGRLVASLPLPDGTDDATVAFRPGGTQLMVSSRDGTWTVDTRVEAWRARACRLAGRNLTAAEWDLWFPDRPYEAACPERPAGT